MTNEAGVIKCCLSLVQFLQVHHLLTNGANLLMPVNLIKSLQLKRCYKAATVLDFAFEAFKEVHMHYRTIMVVNVCIYLCRTRDFLSSGTWHYLSQRGYVTSQ